LSGMAFDSDAAAAEALAAANNADVAPATPAVPAPVEQAPATPVVPNTVDAGTNLSESFTSIDTASLPPEIRAQVEEAIKPFQADYTRKTQEIAPIRQIMSETGMSAEEAQQALTFVQSLNDPAQLQKLYEHLQSQFDGETPVEPVVEDGTVDPRDTELQSLSARLERFEQAQALSEAQAALTNAETSVRQAHPDFQDADIERVQQLAISHMQTDKADIATAMNKAAADYKAWKDATLADYIANKGKSSGDGTPVLGDSTHADTPAAPFATLEEATKAAIARFGNSI